MVDKEDVRRMFFDEGKKQADIARELGVTKEWVRQIISDHYTQPLFERLLEAYAKENGIYRKQFPSRFKDKIPDFSFTDHCEFTSWFLGVIYGDGFIPKSNKQISIGMKDTDVIDQINGYFGDVFGTRDHNGAKYLTICSKRLCRELYDLYGVKNNKASILKWPDLPEDMYRHFIRGLVDSDGCFYLEANGYLKFRYGCVAEQFMYDFADRVQRDIIIVSSKFRVKQILTDNKPLFSFTLYNGDAKRFGDYVYRDATYYGKRKYTIYTGCIVNTSKMSHGLKQTIKEHYREGATVFELMSLFSLTEEQVKKCIKNLE